MNKYEFIASLTDKLHGLPQEDIEEHLNFYIEMIDDRMEDGLSEEDAVTKVGPVDRIAAQILADIPLSKIAQERIKPKRRLNAGEIVLLALGSPIWLSLGIAAFAVIFSLYVSLWAVIISLWSAFAALAGSAVGGILASSLLAIDGYGSTALAMLAAGIICTGLSIFLFFGCNAATKGTLLLTKKFPLWIKNCFMKKEEV